MEAVKLNAQGVAPFMHLISINVAEEIKKSIRRHPDIPTIGEGFAVYGAYDEDVMKPCGVLVVQITGTVVIIRSLFVDPQYRSFGVARALIDRLLYEALATDDIAEIEMIALAESTEQMEVAEFLHSMGFILEEAEERSYRTVLARIIENGRLSKAPFKGAVPLKDVPDSVLRAFGNSIVGADTTFIPLPINRQDYDQDVSMVKLKDNAISDIILVEKARDGLIVSYVLSGGNGIGAMMVIAAAMHSAAEKYRPDMPVKIPVVTEESKKLVEQIVSDAYESTYVRCYYSMLPFYFEIFGREDDTEHGK